MEKQKASEADAQRKKMEELEQKRAENIKKREAGKGAPAAPKAKEKGTKYTKTEVKQLKSIFDEYDKDKMGSINLIEFKEAIRKQGDAQARQEAYEKAQKRGGGKNGAVVAIIPTDQKSGGSSIREQFEGLFSQMDKDGDGEVTFRELLEVLYPLATENEKKIMLEWVQPEPEPEPEPEVTITEEEKQELQDIFNLYDKDKDKKLTLKELQGALQATGMLNQEIKDMFEKHDSDNNKSLNFDEFIGLMRTV